MLSRRLTILTVSASASLCFALAFVPALGQLPPGPRPGQTSAEIAISKDVEKIKDEGLNRSEVMATLEYLSEVIGPRLTASPNMKRANEWTRDKMSEYGLKNAHLESWGPFGKGWTLKKFSAQVVEPECIPLIAFPKAWSPGFDEPITAEVVHLDVRTDADFAKFKGKLKGKIVVVGSIRELKAHFEPDATRRTDKQLLDLADAEVSTGGRRSRPTDATKKADATKKGDAAKKAAPGGEDMASRMTEIRAQFEVARKRLAFVVEEGAAAVLEPSTRGDFGTLFVQSASLPNAASPFDPAAPGARRASVWDKDAPKTVPQIVVSIEHQNRLIRLLKHNKALTMTIDLKVEFHDKDLMGYNTVAEIPGTDLKDEVVMLGGHMDSWHSGTGATDNAAGCAIAIEAVRILQKAGLKPRRTIRVGLWSGEEQGLMGSAAYVKEHFGTAAGGGMRGMGGGGGGTGPLPKITVKPDYDKFSGYFNYDNGSGKIRGIYLQGNETVGPIFRKWLQPFKEMGAQTITLSNTGGTDHQSFDAIGLPGFQFIQDEIEYDTRTHHSNQDVYDRLQAEDLKQSATIMAAFVYQSAMRDEKLPRKPTGPKTAEPGKTASTK